MELPSEQKGFTFLEVMAAIVVITVMSLTAVQLVKNTNDEFIKVKTTRHAYELAQQKLYELVENDDLASYSGSSGSFDSDESYTWISEMHTSSTPGLRVLEVTVKCAEVKVDAVLNYIIFSE